MEWKEIDMDNVLEGYISSNSNGYKYYASDTGLIKSVNKKGKEIIRKTNINRHGYESITLSLYHCGKKKRVNASVNVHRIIAKTFIPNPENKPCVNHINEIRTDNRVENLEWCTYSENNYHGTHVQRMIETKKLKKELEKNNLILTDSGQIMFDLDKLLKND